MYIRLCLKMIWSMSEPSCSDLDADVPGFVSSSDWKAAGFSACNMFMIRGRMWSFSLGRKPWIRISNSIERRYVGNLLQLRDHYDVCG